jgi:hypothetical protein
MDCPMKYAGQTGRTFHTVYWQHTQAIRNNNSNLGYLNHVLNTGHAYWSVTNTMAIIKTEKEGKHLNTLERYYVYKTSNMNDIHIATYNQIFETLSISLYLWRYSPFIEPWPLFSFLILYSVGRTPWTGYQPVARQVSTNRKTQTQYKRTQISMPWVGFETAVPAFQREKTGSCLRRCHCDWRCSKHYKNWTLDSSTHTPSTV